MKRVEKVDSKVSPKVIWIGFQDKQENIKRFMIKHDVESSVVFDEGNVVSKQYGIRYGAGLVVINGEGIVKKRVPKGFSEKELTEAVRAVMNTEDTKLDES